MENGYLVTISYRKLNTFRHLFGPPFTMQKGYWSPFSHTKLSTWSQDYGLFNTTKTFSPPPPNRSTSRLSLGGAL